MERLKWHCSLLLLFFYVHLLVDCKHSDLLTDQTPFNSSSPNSKELSHREECLALLQFKNSTSRSSPQCQPCINNTYIECSPTDSWMEGKDCCSWHGVQCDPETGKVNYLNLMYSCLSGTLNNLNFLQLTHIEQLILNDNSLTGPIPMSLAKLEKLFLLDLSRNKLSGQIPDFFSNFRQLSSLDLSGNHFVGLIPYSLCKLPNLPVLDLSDNFLNGEVPSCLFNMPSLLSIKLANNQLTGPAGQFKPTSSMLAEVDLGKNKINGSIQSSIFELVNLTYLDLSSNNLTGTFRFDMLSKLRRLRSLDLSSNSLLSFSFDSNVQDIFSIDLNYLNLSSCNISEFPSFLSNLENLQSLDLSNNKIHGQIFQNGSKGWVSLTYLNLAHNFLTHVEHPWKNIQKLELQNNSIRGSLFVPPSGTNIFLISNNKMTGVIPPSICNLSLLYGLDLSNNNFAGPIPKCFGSSVRLKLLHLSNNNFQGSVPDTFENGSLLTSLDLSDNNLKGPLPRSLNLCSKVEVINVGNNNISDIFPYWLGTLPMLKILVLRYNQFYGPIDDSETIFSNLHILDLSNNQFMGYLSKFFYGNLEAMMSVDDHDYEQATYIGGNYYSSEELKLRGNSDDNDHIDTANNFNSWRKFRSYGKFDYYQDSFSMVMKGQLIEFQRIIMDFKAIDLSNNCFEGSIPEILGKFKSLIVLNLSHNSLTGNIPSSFGNMKALESLDLSSNKLTGRIPQQMESLTFLEVLNLSHNKFLGPIPQGGQFATFEIGFFIGNKGLCGKPLPKKCGNDLVPSIPSSVLQVEDDTAIEFDWKITMMGYGCGQVIGLSIGYIILSTGKLQWLEMIVEGWLRKKFRRTC